MREIERESDKARMRKIERMSKRKIENEKRVSKTEKRRRRKKQRKKTR